MAKYRVEIDLNGESLLYIFDDHFPTEFQTGDMSALKKIVELNTKRHMKENHPNTRFSILEASYNIWDDDNPEHNFEIDMNHPNSDLRQASK